MYRYPFILLALWFWMGACHLAATPEVTAPASGEVLPGELPAFSPEAPNPGNEYSTLEYQGVERLRAAPGTKSVLFNSAGNRLYAMNLEGMSIYEFDRANRQVQREFRFRPTRGTGWDYENDKSIPSWQEKPVEACLTHGDSLLWVSLHNAEGIVPIQLHDLAKNRLIPGDTTQKRLTVLFPGSTRKETIGVPLIRTGKTPKIIARTSDNRHLLVSNWHSYTVSVLDVDRGRYPFARLAANLPMPAIPRGIAVDDRTGKAYVAIMGGASLSVINTSTWKKEPDIAVASNPRHVVMDSNGHLFLSYNLLGKVACLDAATGATLFDAATHGKPRTIILSRNQKFLFATCYASDTVDVFRVNPDGFSKLISLPCKGHPVGVDLFEDEQQLEAWVCSYTGGTISVFRFRKK